MIMKMKKKYYISLNKNNLAMIIINKLLVLMMKNKFYIQNKVILLYKI